MLLTSYINGLSTVLQLIHLPSTPLLLKQNELNLLHALVTSYLATSYLVYSSTQSTNGQYYSTSASQAYLTTL